MKKIYYYLSLCLITLLFATACSDDNEDVNPGLYTANEIIETFPGDTIFVTGTASNYVGISSITLGCEDWKVEKVYNLGNQHPKVFNYNYKLVVPQDATFQQVMDVTVCDKNGLSTKKSILLKFLPDMTSPTVTSGLANEVSIDYDTSLKKSTWSLSISFHDDRALKSAHLQIPGISFDEVHELSGRADNWNCSVDFEQVGEFTATLSVTDASDNEFVQDIKVVSMLAETENPIQDYAQMYVIDADENADDYLNGYYRYMDRKGEYQYEGKFYAGKDNAHILFVPTRSMSGDMFGVSPYVNSKLMNNNGYVVPVTLPKKGYYGIWIDLNAHTYSTWSLDIPADACTEPIWLSGTGFGFGDWKSSDEMTKTDTYRYEVETTMADGYTGDCQYYFYTAGWARVFRGDAEGNWWYESGNGPCVTFKPTYYGKVKVTYDSAAPWATIKKCN